MMIAVGLVSWPDSILPNRDRFITPRQFTIVMTWRYDEMMCVSSSRFFLRLVFAISETRGSRRRVIPQRSVGRLQRPQEQAAGNGKHRIRQVAVISNHHSIVIFIMDTNNIALDSRRILCVTCPNTMNATTNYCTLMLLCSVSTHFLNRS